MGEEEKKVEEKKDEEKPKKIEELGEKKIEGKEEKSSDKGKADDESSKELPVPPPPPQEIVLRVYMHCEGCARKVRRSLKGFQGVEDVKTDCKTDKVVVKGEKADPLKVLARVQQKSHRQVELLSPIPPPLAEPKKVEEIEIPKPPEKKEEPQVITVVLKVHMHCEACAQEIKKRIERMKGVENVEPDLKASEVTVKGVFEAPKLVEYVKKRTGKHAVVVKQEPAAAEKNKEEVKENDDEGKDEKKGGDKDQVGKKVEEPPAAKAAPPEEKKEEGGKGGGDDHKEVVSVPAAEKKTEVMELKKNEFYYYYPPVNYQMYPPRVATEMYSYPPAPQIFSDENPNACSVM